MEERWNEIKAIWRKNRLLLPFSVGSLMFFAGFIIGTASYMSQPEWLSNFSENFWIEAIGILITVIVIDRIYAANSLHDRKILLFNQLKSRANSVAVDALEQIRREGWLDEVLAYYDNEGGRASLRHLELQHANLNGIELRNVELRTSKLYETDLRNAKLIGCDLAFSNVRNAFLGNTDLRGCDLFRIEGEFAIHSGSDASILPDGTLWSRQTDFSRFSDDSHPEYKATRIKINEIRKYVGLPPVEE
jgi:hypothetical protein